MKKENGPIVTISPAPPGASSGVVPGSLPGTVSGAMSGAVAGAVSAAGNVMTEEMASLLASNPHLAQALSSMSLPVSREFVFITFLRTHLDCY